MTSLTDKMEGLRKDTPSITFSTVDTTRGKNLYVAPLENWTYNACLDDCIALVEAEAAVVGDWQVEFDKRFEINLDGEPATGMTTVTCYEAEIKTFITTLLAAKEREIVEAYKKGFIDGGLNKQL